MKSFHSSGAAIFDWEELHARLAQAATKTRRAMVPSPKRAAMVLEQRARHLARPLAAPRPAGVMLDLLVFTLASERYAIETCHVQEVCRLAGLTPVPQAPEFVAGLANLRGQVLVVFDVRLLLGLKPNQLTDTSRIVVCGDAQPDLGFVVDCASDVIRLPADALQQHRPRTETHAESFIRGTAPDATIVIDGAALLADQRLFIGQPGRP